MRIFILSLSLVLALVQCQDYSCPKGKSKPKKIMLSPGDSYSFNTNYDNEAEYLAKTKCPVQYKASKKCKDGIRFSCSSFDLVNRDAKKCRKGDRLMIGKKAYCKENGPDPVTLKGKAAKKGLKIQFLSDKKLQASGAQCTAECLDGAAATTTEAPTTTSGILITAGYKTRTKTAEIYFPSTDTGCSLPDLPEPRGGHTQDGELACGGIEAGQSTAERSCVKWGNGTWSRSHNLGISRSQHVSWATASGVYLIGGIENSRTSTLVKENGSVEEGFNLEYPTERACSIPDNENEEVIITGGYSRKDFSGYSTKTVSVYSTDGWQRNLPSMQEGRYLHACSSFLYRGRRTLIVTGGYDGSERLDSTEIYDRRGSWQQVQRLPYPMNYISATTFNNRILLFGGPSNERGVSKAILELDLENNQQAGWRQIGKMKEGRLGPGVTTVSYTAMQDYARSCI